MASYPKPPSKPGVAKTAGTSGDATTVSADDFKEVSDARRIKDVDSARTIFNRLIQDNSQRSETFATVRNQLEGGRPRDPAELEASGESWSCNVNFGYAFASFNRTLLPYWKMVHDVPHIAAFTINSNAPQSEQWQASFADAFDQFHEDWGTDYRQQFMQACSNFVKFGPGPAMWCDPDTARYKAVNPQRLYFPKNTNMSPDSWEVVAFVRDVPVTELYAYIKDKTSARRAKDAGWNTNSIKATIVQAATGGPAPDYRDYTRYQDQLVNNDIMVTTPYEPQAVVWLYVKQFDGTIGCYVFNQFAGVNDFLYVDEKAADTFRELFAILWYDTGVDGMVHSIKGFGIKNYFFELLVNRMKSRLVDAATFSMGVNFQYADNNTPDETPPVENFGAFTVFPSGLNQLAIYPNLKQASDVMRMLESNANENNSLYRDQAQQIENTDTATQAKILAGMQGQLTEASAALFLSQLGECFFTEQVRRLRRKGNRDEDAKKFVQRLKESGVPEEVIYDKPVRVKTGANAGMANPALRIQQFQEGLALASFPGVNTRWFLENLIAYKYGANALAPGKAMLPEGAESEPIERRQAIMENVDFGQGVMLQVAPSDAHFEHIQEHIKPVAGILQGFQAQGSITPEQTTALTITVEHMGQHMMYLQKDETKKNEFQQVLPQFRLIQSTARGILQRMQQNQNTQGHPGARPGGPSPIAPVVPMNSAQ